MHAADALLLLLLPPPFLPITAPGKIGLLGGGFPPPIAECKAAVDAGVVCFFFKCWNLKVQFSSGKRLLRPFSPSRSFP